jgi:hypothetical protein
MTQSQGNPNQGSHRQNLSIRIPTVLTLRDILAFVAVAVSITVAWGVIGTRLAIAEKEIVSVVQTNNIEQTKIDQIIQRQDILERRLREDESLIEELWRGKNH